MFTKHVLESLAEEAQGTDVVIAEAIEKAKSEEEVEAVVRKSRMFVIQQMSIAEKIRLSVLGNMGDRNILMRDRNKLVSMAAVKSPKMTEQEILSIAANKFLDEEIVGYVAGQRKWVKNYQVIHRLVCNPKCPSRYAVSFIKLLKPFDLTRLARDKTVPQSVARLASQVIHSRDSGAKKKH